MSLRAIKAQARGDLHQAMRVPALYLATRASTPVPVHVRIHTSFKALGDMKGTSFSYAEVDSEVPAVLFWREEFPNPMPKGIISVAADEAYQIDHVQPADGQTITTKVVRLIGAGLVGLPLPAPEV